VVNAKQVTFKISQAAGFLKNAPKRQKQQPEAAARSSSQEKHAGEARRRLPLLWKHARKDTGVNWHFLPMFQKTHGSSRSPV